MKTENSIEDLNTRLGKTIRTQKLIITSLIFTVAGIVTIAAAPQIRNGSFDEITAKKIVVVNDLGEPKAVIAVIENGGTIRIYNAEGKVRADIAMPTGPVDRIGAGTGDRKTIMEKLETVPSKVVDKFDAFMSDEDQPPKP